MYFTTNKRWDTRIEDDTKNFIMELLKPTEEFQKYIYEKKSEIPFNTYNILHYRLGDDELVRNILSCRYDDVLHNFRKNVEYNDILLSDSTILKEFIENEEVEVFMYDTEPGHLASCKDEQKIKDSLFEFLLISDAKKIKTFSVYSWISGFVECTSLIYDIELKNIK